MTRRLLLALFLLAAPLAAQDQTVEPDGTVSETNSDCTTANAHTRLSDNSDATLCDGGDASSAESYTLLLSFPTPTSAPSTTTDAQVFQCRAQKSSTGGDNPTFVMNVYCGGVSHEAGTTTHTVSSTTPAEFSESWTFGGSCTSDGSNVEIEVNVSRTGGAPTGRKSVDSIDCDWDVTYAAAAEEMMVL